MDIHERLGRFLAEQTRGEEHGLAMSEYVTKSTVLTPEEMDDAEARVRDEIRHVRWFRDAANRYGFPPPNLKGIQDGYYSRIRQDLQDHVRLHTPEQMVVFVYIPERFTAKTLPIPIRIAQEYGDQVLVDMLTQAWRDEVRHVDQNSALIHRLRRDPEVGGIVRDTFRAALAQHYRAEDVRAYGQRHLGLY